MSQAFLTADEEVGLSSPNGQRYLPKPSNTFEVSDDDVESGVSQPQKQRGQSRGWLKMGTRERKTYSPEGSRISEEETEGLLDENIAINVRGAKTRSRKRWHERCLCGGNTALSIL